MTCHIQVSKEDYQLRILLKKGITPSALHLITALTSHSHSEIEYRDGDTG